MLLSGKTALITGGNSGIGGAIAVAFAKQNASLVLAARRKEQLEQVAEACRSAGAKDVKVVSVDLSKPEDVERLASTVLTEHGGVDVLVNNAGVSAKQLAGPTGEDPLQGDPAAWRTMMAINVDAPMHLTRRLAPKMVDKKAGIIINICSVAGLEPMAGNPAYAASKWALRGWSKSCYAALRKHNIKVVAIHPGAVDTPMAGEKSEAHERMIKPEDIAEAALLAVRCSPTATPEEITMRPTVPVW